MKARQFICSDERRKLEIALHERLKGIDYIEVFPDQHRLCIYFIPSLARGKKPVPEGIGVLNIKIAGGSKITGVHPKKVEYHQPDDNRLTVWAEDDISKSGVGDFSTYTLKLEELDDLDPIFSEIDFSFKINCPKDMDCREQQAICLPESAREPRLDYLTRDYQGFRRLILDRLSLVMPRWKESNPADVGVVIAEIMAYAADYLAYYQDAVATEAYLGTARKRISVRRHTRLLDYFLDEGCNSRVWVAVQVEKDSVADGKCFPCEPIANESKKVKLLTKVDRFKERTMLFSEDEYEEAISLGAEVFEPVSSITLHSSQNGMLFYTWGEENCCLPRNATKATVVIGGGSKGYPAVGDVLIFEELPEDSVEVLREESAEELKGELRGESKGDLKGESEKRAGRKSADETAELERAVGISAKDLAEGFVKQSGQEEAEEFGYLERRLAVRLTLVKPVEDGLFNGKAYSSLRAYKNYKNNDIHIINIEWCKDDALPFPLCVSRDGEIKSIVRGNVLLADHGRFIRESLPEPKDGALYRPRLKRGPLTQRANPHPEKLFEVQLAGNLASATEILNEKGTGAYPAVKLHESSSGRDWSPERDLLNSGRYDRTFAAEVDDDGHAVLRFGDGLNGMLPFSSLTASYRVGNGSGGNVGADSIGHIYSSSGNLLGIKSLRNPLHAEGGRDPETVDHARLFAPQSLHKREYAVTEEDYALMAKRHEEVQKAVATLRWTGSWNTMFVNIDRKGGRAVDAQFKAELQNFLNRFSIVGFDLEVEGPVYVPLDITLRAVVKPEFFASDVLSSLEEEFSSKKLSDGRTGFFYPDEFSFGDPVYLSQIIARAITVPGVLWAEVTSLQRMGGEAREEPPDGQIEMGRLEIARVDSDPSNPENGTIQFIMVGGR